MISMTFSCSVCSFEIRGEYEEEDFDYPVFCPKCGRQNQLPARTAVPTVQTTVVEPPAQHPQVVHKHVPVETSSNAAVAAAPSGRARWPIGQTINRGAVNESFDHFRTPTAVEAFRGAQHVSIELPGAFARSRGRNKSFRCTIALPLMH